MPDAVDAIIEQWSEARPDLEPQLGAMATIGRLGRVVTHITRRVEAVAGEFGYSVGELDVLFALRRSGPPFELTPSQLARTMMLSPAGVTNRIDRLERDELVERLLDARDRRSFRVRLTATGKGLADLMVGRHVAAEVELLDPLSDAERRALDKALRRLLASFEDEV